MLKNWGPQTPLYANRPRRSFRNSLFFYIAIFCLSFWILIRYIIDLRSPSLWSLNPAKPESKSRCSQVDPLHPARKSKELDDMESYLASVAFRDIAVERLSGAVRIPTEGFDDMGDVGVDPRWDIFYSFADYLSKTYPLTHATLQLEKVNTFGLLYTWPGTDPSLKPNLLMAHQDVVPVPESTVKQWTHPPFSGHFDGKFIWGRGASDCKNTLIAVLSAVEALLAADFIPKRTLILSFGFDEEISGPRGAKSLSEFLIKRYGHNSVAAIIDEGAPNVESWGSSFAVPGVTEKGYVDIDIVVRATGGHSSIPPKHNGIGIASELITLIEGNTYEPHLDDHNPYLELLHCGAEHAPHFPHHLGKLLDKRSSHHKTCSKKPKKDKLALEAAKAGPQIKYLFTTSVAVDLIHGGTKNNALPERTTITVNHRINIGSSSSTVKSHIAALAARLAHKHNLTLHAFSGPNAESPNSITLSHGAALLEPAPVTPTFLISSSNSSRVTPFAVLAGTTRALYDVLVAPGIMTANTDTRYYWGLSEHIFRYAPGWDREQEGLGRIHTVDERMGVKAHVDTVRWMVGWVRNMDEADV